MNKEEITKKPFYLIARYWLGQLRGFIKISDNEEEITKLFEEKYMWKKNTIGITEQSFQLLKVSATELLDDLDEQSPYCEVCGHCGEIGCCGIRNFITNHIEGKTNCKNEASIISDLISLCEYKDEVFEENKKYKEVIDKAINNSQYWIDYYTRLNSDERIALRLQENIDILKEVE